MTISANTLFHFTDSIDAMNGILMENFRINFCRESVDLDGGTKIVYIPMVSFCDLSLSQIKDHIKSYGYYGIGLTKEWGIKMKLNPIMYASSGSRLSLNYKKAYNKFVRGPFSKMTPEQLSMVEMRRYTKNYEGELIRKGVSKGIYRYYDEREWRYTPEHHEFSSLIVTEEFFLENRTSIEKEIEDVRLNFEPKDIKYIILNKESEISPMLQHLKISKGRKYTFHDIELLSTRILLSDQIFNDI